MDPFINSIEDTDKRHLNCVPSSAQKHLNSFSSSTSQYFCHFSLEISVTKFWVETERLIFLVSSRKPSHSFLKLMQQGNISITIGQRNNDFQGRITARICHRGILICSPLSFRCMEDSPDEIWMFPSSDGFH